MSTAPVLTELIAGTAADLPVVARIMADAFDPRFGEAWTKSQCLGMLALPGAWLTLARHDRRVAGFALGRAIAGDGELLLLAVRPPARRHGIGAALLRSVIADAGSRGAQRLHLEVRAGNDAAALYRAHGFAKVGERRGYYRGGSAQVFDAHTFARDLIGPLA